MSPALTVLAIGALLLGMSLVLVWAMASTIAKARDKAHAKALRANAKRLAEAGYQEAADHFKGYAAALENREEKP